METNDTKFKMIILVVDIVLLPFFQISENNQPHLLLLGDSNSIGPPNMPKKFKTGEVRFRAWRMCTFGKPSLVRSLLIDNGNLYLFN